MRSLYIINAEIEKAQRNLNSVERDKNAAEYVPPQKNYGSGLVAYALSIVAAFMTGLTVESAFSEFNTIFAIIALAVLIIDFSFVGKFLSKRTARSVYIFFIVIGVVFCAFGVVGLLFGLNHKSLLSNIIPIISDDPESGSKGLASVSSYAVILLVSIILTIGSVIQSLMETKRKNDSTKHFYDIKAKYENAIIEFKSRKDEYSSTLAEMDSAFAAETSKENPDVARMRELANLGYEAATKWLNEKEERDKRDEARAIYTAEIKKASPDIKAIERAASMNNPDANLWLGLNKAVDCVYDFYDYSDDERYRIFIDVWNNLLLADGCEKTDILELLKIFSCGVMFVYGKNLNRKRTNTENHRVLEKLREMKKSEKLTTKEKTVINNAISIMTTIDDYTTLYADDQPSSRSSYTSDSNDYYYETDNVSYDRRLTESEMKAYVRDKLHYLWNPSVINSDSSLTYSQKQQLLDYSRIYCD